jgi:hypothetical protein
MNKTHQPSAGNNARREATVSCWLCGVRLHSGQMVPDGGSACDDIRWYCRDAGACTDRWTTSRRTLAQTGASEEHEGNDGIGSEASAVDPVDPVSFSDLDGEISALPTPPG